MTVQTIEQTAERTEPNPARPIFSTADFKLLRTAVLAYIHQVEDTPESQVYSHLYHRLGRLR